MGFYDLVSGVLTAVGILVLVYRTVHELDGNNKVSTLEKLCTKWVIFVIFIKVEYWILAVMEIIPLGALALLVVKFLLFMPENPISHKIYKKIQRKLEKIKMDEYHSYLGVYLSRVCKYLVIILLGFIKKVAEYVNSHDIEQAETHIMDIIKAFQYKKAAVNMRSQSFKSDMNRELNDTSFNSSTSEDQEYVIRPASPSRQRKTLIGQKMSKILTDIDEESESNKQVLKLKAELMIVKPNRSLNQKARYEETKVQFYPETCKVTFTNPNLAVETGTLKAIKWITKNMVNIELVLAEGRSKVIKLSEKADVAKWVEPVCSVLQEKHE